MLNWASYLVIAIIVGAIAVGWSRRFLAVGALAIANIVIHAIVTFGPQAEISTRLGVGSVSIVRLELMFYPGNVYALEPFALVQLFTSMFLHGSIFHLIGNLIILLAFALTFEELIGPRKFLAIYVATGVIAVFSQVAAFWGDLTPMLGASGAVFGVIGAFAGSFPNRVMRLPLPLPIIIFVRMRVINAAILFALMQLALQFFANTTGAGSNVAYAAHLGGLAGGLLIAWLFVRRLREANTVRPVRIDIDMLSQFAIDEPTQRAFKEMKANRDEPAVFRAWFERFWQGARDPETKQKVRPGPNGKIIREDGTEFDVRLVTKPNGG